MQMARYWTSSSAHEHIRIDFDRAGQGASPTDAMGHAARAKVLRSRFLGQNSLVDFKLEQGAVLTAFGTLSVFAKAGHAVLVAGATPRIATSFPALNDAQTRLGPMACAVGMFAPRQIID